MDLFVSKSTGNGVIMNVGERRGRPIMTDSLQELLAAAKGVKSSSDQNEEQRRSFAYGNTAIENSRITRETVDKEAEKLKRTRRDERRARTT